jgi:RND family efflux transporter MFP subunit
MAADDVLVVTRDPGRAMRLRPVPLLLMLATVATACSREVGLDPAGGVEAPLARLTTGTDPGSGVPQEPGGGSLEAPSAPGQATPGSYAGVLHAERDAEVGALVPGIVRSVHVELGDRVRAGQLLVTLRDDEEAARIGSAEAALEFARLEHDRAVQLGSQGMITREELERSAYRVRAAGAALREARVRLEYTRVRAPFDGAVTRRRVRPGEIVEERAPLLRVTALRPLRVLVRVPEADSHGLEAGQPVRLGGRSGEQADGRVFRVSPAVDASSGTVDVLVEVADPGTLRPGSAVTVELAAPPARAP